MIFFPPIFDIQTQGKDFSFRRKVQQVFFLIFCAALPLCFFFFNETLPPPRLKFYAFLPVGACSLFVFILPTAVTGVQFCFFHSFFVCSSPAIEVPLFIPKRAKHIGEREGKKRQIIRKILKWQFLWFSLSMNMGNENDNFWRELIQIWASKTLTAKILYNFLLNG